MDIKKRIGAAVLPIAAMVILGLIDSLTDVFVPSMSTAVGFVVLAADFAVLGWAGFKVAKENGTMTESAVTGSIAGTVSFFISIILSIALGVDIPPTDTLGLILLSIIGVILGAVFGLIFGAAGGFLGRKKAKTKK